MEFNYKQYHVAIYGDGEYEYDGYYLVVIDEFDEWDNPTKRKRAFYVKSNSKDSAREFVCHMIDIDYVMVLREYEKVLVRKIWEVITQ